ncbi:MAG TPA: NADH-quinone oxidoreductase subunit K [Polyangiaceae bacterium]|nr:NADH-quinone oxidoreductase subunit K [Polyangiaceae bacterium]
MQLLLAFLVGVLVAGGASLLLSRDFYRVVLGVMVMSNGVNLFLLACGRLRGERTPPIVEARGVGEAADFAVNPLPQALVLTAIVITFGIAAFLLTLVGAAERDIGTLDVEAMRLAEPPEEERPGHE